MMTPVNKSWRNIDNWRDTYEKYKIIFKISGYYLKTKILHFKDN